MVPGGDLIGSNNSGLGVPDWLQFGVPLMIAIEAMTNHAAFTGQTIYNKEVDHWDERWVKSLQHAYRSWMPSWAPGSKTLGLPSGFDAEHIGNAARGGTTVTGKPYDLTTEAYNALGVNIKGQNTRENRSFQGKRYDRIERAINENYGAAGRKYGRNLLNDEELEEAKQREERHVEWFNELIKKDQGLEE